MKLYGVWEVSLEGETYRWEPDEVTPGEEIMVLAECGLDTYDKWLEAVDEREAIASQTLIWFLRRKAGRQEDRNAVLIHHRKIHTVQVEKPQMPSVPEVSAGSGSETPDPASSSTSSTGTESDPPSGAS